MTAFHNTCRHRGAERCSQDEKPMGRLISCPYQRLVLQPFRATRLHGLRYANGGSRQAGTRALSRAGEVLEWLRLSVPRRRGAGAGEPQGARHARQLANGQPDHRPSVGQGSRLQLEALLGELQRMPALPGYPSRAVRYGAALQAGHHVAGRGAELDAGNGTGVSAEKRSRPGPKAAGLAARSFQISPRANAKPATPSSPCTPQSSSWRMSTACGAFP